MYFSSLVKKIKRECKNLMSQLKFGKSQKHSCFRKGKRYFYY